ncbi:MAG: hypothetical protein HY868_11490 [Chloroflexi bacterium]|nr:hypothetical protein [Chloroflexota bacterium]
MNQRPTNSFLRALDALLEGRPGAWFINIVAIPLMILLILVLPPLALPQRVLSAGYTGIAGNRGGGVAVEDGTQLSIPANASKSGVSIKLSRMTRDAFLKSSLAKDLPIMLDVKSAAYQPSIQGALPALAIMSIVLPEEIDPIATLDVYGYNGKKWIKIPFQMYLEEDRLEAYLTSFVPSTVVVAQTQTQAPAIGTDVAVKSPLPAPAAPLIAEITPLGLTIAVDGGVAGSVPAFPEVGSGSPYQVLPTIGNLEGAQSRADLVEAMIGDKTIRAQHIQVLVDLAVDKLYPGLNVDYQGVSPDMRNDFTTFVRELAQALHAKDKILSVTVPLPAQKAQDAWDSGAYNWDTLGQLADIVRIPMPANRGAYANDPSEVRLYLQWAVGRVDRYKLQLMVSMMSRDEFGNSFAPIPFANASKLIGPVAVPPTKPEPGDKVTLELPKLREGGGLKLDEASGLYTFTYKDDKGQAHTVALENAESLGRKIALAQEFNLRGVALRDLGPDTVEPRVWDALKQYRESQSVAFKGAPVITWRVDGQNVGKSPAGDPRFVWTAPNQPGDSRVEAALSLDDGRTLAGTTGSTNVSIARAPTPVPTPAPAIPRPTAAPVAPAAVAAPPSAFRGKNLFAYGAQLNWTNSDNNAEMSTLNSMGFTWAKVQIRWCDAEGGGRGNIDWSQMDRLIGAAQSKGIKVMFSVVCAPNWSRADRGAGGSGPPDNMQDAADFMGKAAAKYCGGALGAIEVWNEHNLLTEWHGKQINAALYMDMLKKSYTSIKAACPGIVVVSGAPTPTGVMSDTAIDDVVFLQQMYANGLKQYSDAVGAHPSGFCNAPDATVGTMNPCGGQYGNHRSFFFQDTMKAYRNVMVANGDGDKQIWPTEFGWGVHSSPHPGYEYEKFISDGIQAQWLVKAYQMMKAWGWVGVAILWNLDFMDMNNETGAFHVVGRPAKDALAGMPK